MAFISVVLVFSLGVGRKTTAKVKTVYYVVQATENIEATCSQISLRGGAGYAIAHGVAFGVYFSESEAELTLRRLESEYSEVSVYPLDVSIVSSVDAFAYNLLEVVEGWKKVLQNGGAQDTVKEGLQSVAKVLSWRAEKENSPFLLMLSGELKGCLEERVLYVDTLRKFICFGCEQLSLKNRMIRI